jgi:hypothetical protein
MTQLTRERTDDDLRDEPTAIPESPVDTAPRTAAPWLLRAIGIAAGVLIGLFVIWMVGGLRASVPEATPATTDVAGVQEAPPPDTLGITFEDLKEEWNALEKPPLITVDLRRVPESGSLDSFSHRFDESAVVAGAYGEDDYLVALMVRSSIHHPAIANMHRHVCYLVDPSPRTCIDNYFEKGLGGKKISKLGKLSEKGHEASWNYKGNQWQVTIEGDIQTIRVIAPTAE